MRAAMAWCATLMLLSRFSHACPNYPEWSKAAVLQHMNESSRIYDTGIAQKDCTLTLAIVGYTTNREIARKKGEYMLRLAKTFGPGPDPLKQIGTGIYDYVIGVFRTDGLVIEVGIKAKDAERITWLKRWYVAITENNCDERASGIHCTCQYDHRNRDNYYNNNAYFGFYDTHRYARNTN